MPSVNGLDIPNWEGRRAADALAWVRRQYSPLHTTCVICHQPIDYSIRGTDDSLSVQHVKPRSKYPQLTWVRSNWRPAHLSCNRQAGDRTPQGIGISPI
jgi:5-methylcytosine-specific restriction endonuclease McrA